MKIRPIIWSSNPDQPLAALTVALEQARLFYAAYNCPLEILPSVVAAPPVTIHPAAYNPWNPVWGALQTKFVPGETILVLLDGWGPVEATSVVGWGGYPLAVVGEYVLRRLRTAGSPDAIVDDGAAIGAIVHELGHCLGFMHDFSDRNVMSAWWIAFPNPALPSTAMLEAWSPVGWKRLGVDTSQARLSFASCVLEACRIPEAA